jgi:hypothetical protein
MTLNISYPQKRQTGGAIFGWSGAGNATTADYNYAAANNITVGLDCSTTDANAIYNYTYSSGSLTTFYNNCIAPLEAKGIYWTLELEYFWAGSWLDLNTPWNMPPYPESWFSGTPNSWDAVFGPFLTWIFDNHNDYFAGPHYEGGNWNMWAYLADKCAGHSPCCFKSGGRGGRPAFGGSYSPWIETGEAAVQGVTICYCTGTDSNGNPVQHTEQDFTLLVPEIEFEIYTPYMLYDGCLPWMAAVVGVPAYAKTRMGINFDQVGSPSNTSSDWWLPSGITISTRARAEQLGALQKFNYIRDLYGAFDWYDVCYQNYQGDFSSGGYDWYDSLGIIRPGTSQSLSVNL